MTLTVPEGVAVSYYGSLTVWAQSDAEAPGSAAGRLLAGTDGSSFLNHITEGISPTTFSPKQTVTRAQMVTFLWAANGKPEPESDENPFTDVSESAWYYKAVLWAVENGITSGVTPTTFGPKQVCNRAQVVTFLWAASGKPEPEAAENPFTDVSESAWYYKAVLWAFENGVTGGTTATTFSPKTNCTRTQVVTFLYKVYGT